MRLFNSLLAVIVGIVILSFITGHGYVWGGIQETYFRGWKNSNIDDLEFRDIRVLQSADVAQPWAEQLNDVNPFTEEDEAWNAEYLSASFLVIQNDTIRHETYWQGHDAQTVTNSFSACKSIVALAIGLASDRGLLDVNDSVAKYLPRFIGEAGRGLTIKELLQMRSHIPIWRELLEPIGFHGESLLSRGHSVFGRAVHGDRCTGQSVEI